MTTNREAPRSESLMGELREDGTLVFERLLPGPIERVWAYLVDGEKRASWLGGGDMPVAPGASGRMTFNLSRLTDETPPERFVGADAPMVMDYKVLACEPPRRVRFTWPDAAPEGETPPAGAIGSEVEIELIPQGQEVRLRLTHSGMHYGRDGTVGLMAGWETHLGLLADDLGRASRRPFWASYLAAEARYSERI